MPTPSESPRAGRRGGRTRRTRPACAGSSATRDPGRRARSSSRGSTASSTAATTRPGIALVDDAGDLFVEKRAGKLANLQTAIADRTPHAAIGLAHTRWATHGRPNDLNAHPHQDCTGEITVIHNGIIENFRELRDGLEARGHTLTSETDTEAIAHLDRGGLRRATWPTRSAHALRQIEGAYAIVVMHRGEGDRLVGARKDVPLVVGLGRRRELPRLATWRRSSPTPTRSSSSRRATSPTCGRGA